MTSRQHDLVIAFYPHARGFAYVVFEGPLLPIDWGMSDVPAREKARRCLRRLSLLLDQYRPDALLIREVTNGHRKRSIGALLAAIKEEARSRRLFTVAVSRKQIQEAFAYLGSPTRRAIVEAIAKHAPTFASYVPPIRKIWNGEDRRMGLFDAIALALAFYKNERADETPERLVTA
jgi:hypothetical protein